MKKNRYIRFVILLLVLANSCQNKGADGSYIIKVREEISSEPKDLQLSAFGKKLEYVKLESTPEVSLRHIQKLYLTGQSIYVSDRKGLYVFDEQGVFVKEIGRIGHGPGEHSGNIRFAVNDAAHEIYVYNFLKNIMVYDQNSGLFLREFPVEYNVCDIAVPENDRLAFFTWDTDRVLNPYEVIFMDTSGNMLETIDNLSRDKIMGNVSAYASNYQFNETLRYLYIYNDTLYNISADFKRTPYAVFRLENNVTRAELSVAPEIVNHPDLLAVSRVTENDRYIFLSVQKGIHGGVKQDISYMIFDKQAGKLSHINDILNDMDGGLAFWPQWIINGTMIDYLHAHVILDYFNESQSKGIVHSPEFMNMVKSLTENDNPVLVFVK